MSSVFEIKITKLAVGWYSYLITSTDGSTRIEQKYEPGVGGFVKMNRTRAETVAAQVVAELEAAAV